MLMNYHELSCNQPRDNPAIQRDKQMQFMIICTVMIVTMSYSFITAGGFDVIHWPTFIQQERGIDTKIHIGIFPGGTYIYKRTKRDYAAANSLLRHIAKNDINMSRYDMVDRMYAMYLDDPNKIESGRKQRFACGYLNDYSIDGNINATKLIHMNDTQIANQPKITKDEFLSMSGQELWPRLIYRKQILPSVNCAILHFPHTDGFVSALITSIFIIPTLRNYVQQYHIHFNNNYSNNNNNNNIHKNAQETTTTTTTTSTTTTTTSTISGGEGTAAVSTSGSSSSSSSTTSSTSSTVVLSTCSIRDQMCTYYAPLYMGEENEFLLGAMDAETYLQTLPKREPILNWDMIQAKYFPNSWKKLIN